MALLTVQSLKRYFDVRDRFGSGRRLLKAVDGIDFSIGDNSIFALVGESGCGKSTVARLVLGLLQPTSGRVFFQDKDIWLLHGDSLRQFRRSVQIIFQDPFASLNPRKTVMDTVSEPIRIHKLAERREIKGRVIDLLRKVGLDDDALNRYPHEFSGGQRQRICIARALAVSPRLIVADEPLSALDVSIQAQILNLLKEIKDRSSLSFLFISHDLRVVHYFSDSIGVMYLGKIVEQAGVKDLFERPLHPYTEVLLTSVPEIGVERGPLPLTRYSLLRDIGEVPSPIDIPSGCPFHPRCPKRFAPCDRIEPHLRVLAGPGATKRSVACHLWNPI